MGFKVPQNTITFELTGDYAGAELTCRRGVSIETYLTLARMARSLEQATTGSAAMDAGLADVTTLTELFAERVAQRWNFEAEDGLPLPLTAETLRSLPIDLLMTVIGKWVELAVSVPIPLEPGSSDGVTLAVASTNGAS